MLSKSFANFDPIKNGYLSNAARMLPLKCIYFIYFLF